MANKRYILWAASAIVAMVAFAGARTADAPEWAVLVITALGAMIGSFVGAAITRRVQGG